MIEKLSEYKITKRDGDYINADNNTQIINTLVCKINELVDAVNTIQKEREAERFEIQEWIGILEAVHKSVNVHEKQIDELQMKVEPEKCETPADQYSEQRKWIGKLCWYKLCEGDTWKVGRLEKIQENADAGYPFVFDGLCYKICEPVKPDDDIIFKDK